MIAYPCLILAAILSVLVLPAAFGERSWKRFATTFFVSAFGVMLPLFIFLFSAALVPDWKGGCRHGWLDCFHQGKLALTPLVLWATAALYAVEVSRTKPPTRWIRLALFVGATVAGMCFLYGLLSIGGSAGTMLLWLLVPFYVTVWHAIRAYQLMAVSQFKPVTYALTFCGSMPFWIGGLIWSRRIYESLPNNPPNCFVVTAASRGHRKFVGPFYRIKRHGRTRAANQQLLTLWQLEALWSARAPRSHASFRFAYDRLGPGIARRLTSTWAADAAYVALQPAEFLARMIVSLATPQQGVTL